MAKTHPPISLASPQCRTEDTFEFLPTTATVTKSGTRCSKSESTTRPTANLTDTGRRDRKMKTMNHHEYRLTNYWKNEDGEDCCTAPQDVEMIPRNMAMSYSGNAQIVQAESKTTRRERPHKAEPGKIGFIDGHCRYPFRPVTCLRCALGFSNPPIHSGLVLRVVLSPKTLRTRGNAFALTPSLVVFP